MKRVFLGIPLSQEIVSTINHLFQQLRDTGGKFIFVSVENLHFTVKFLGDVDEKNIHLVKEKIRNIVCSQKKFSVEVKRVGVFPSLKKISVVWIGSESGELTSLIKEVNMALRFIRQEDYDSIVAHATLARLKSGKNKQKIQEFVERHRSDNFGSMVVDTAVLYESTLTPLGPTYTVLEKFNLRE